jgi:hypothetical protein
MYMVRFIKHMQDGFRGTKYHTGLRFVILCVRMCGHLMRVCCTDGINILIYTYLPDCWLAVSIRKVLRPATSAKVFLGFPVSKSER